MLSHYLVDVKKLFTKTKILGTGTFGVAYEGYRNTDNLHVAIKELKGEIGEERSQQLILRELEILATVKNPSCLSLVAFSFVPPIIVTPFIGNGTLKEALDLTNPSKYAGFTATKKMCSLYGVCMTMDYLHRRSIIHRDLKPENIFLNEDYEIVIADFGLSRIVEENIDITLQAQGSPVFMAPELYTEKYGAASNAIDVYSFGVMLLFYFGPFQVKLDDNRRPNRRIEPRRDFLIRVGHGARLERPPNVPDKYWELYQLCTSDDPSSRPTFKELADQFETDESLFFEGVDLNEYQQYIAKVKLQSAPEPPPSPTPDPKPKKKHPRY